MIKQTKEQFAIFLQKHNIDFDNNGVIIATLHLTQDGNQPLCELPNSVRFKNIVVYKESDFVYNDVTNEDYKSLLREGDLILNDAKYKVNINGFATEGNFVVVYELYPEYISADDVFSSNIPVVSIDYVNGIVSSINFTQEISGLKEINLVDGSTTIGGYTASLYLTVNNQLYVGNSNELPYEVGSFKGKKLVLPSTFGTTYTIPANCFAGNTELLEVVIPNCCTGIGAGAFKGCTNLQHVYISESVTTIGGGAFDGCIYPELDFEVETENTKYIGFKGCLLEKNNSDNTYSIIHATACFFDPNSTHYFTNIKVCIDGANAPGFTTQTAKAWPGMYYKENGTVHLYDTNGKIITTSGLLVQTLDTNTPITACYVPIYFLIKEIKENACIGDTNMINVILCQWNEGSSGIWPDNHEVAKGLMSLQTIGANAFNGCSNIIRFKIPNQSSEYEDHYGWLHGFSIGDSALEGCTKLEIFVFDWSEVTFGTKALFNCTGLMGIAGRLCLEHATFNTTTGKCEIMPGYTRYYGELCFANTPSLRHIDDLSEPMGSNIIYNSIPMITVGCMGTEFDSNGGVKAGKQGVCHGIADNAFYGCISLNHIGYGNTISFNGIYTVGASAFYGCTGLNGVIDLTSDSTNGLSIYDKAFYGCTNLTDITMDSLTGTTTLYSQAFAKTGINTFYAPTTNNMVLMSTDVFDDCVLWSVDIAANSNSLNSPHPLIASNHQVNEKNALISKYNVTDNPMTLIKAGPQSNTLSTWDTNENLTEIKSNAFAGVSNVVDGNKIYIPSTVDVIGETIFNDSMLSNQPSYLGILTLEGATEYVNDCIINDSLSHSIALLLKIGGKYFENILTQTAGYEGQSYHCYRLSVDNNNESISLIEHYYSSGLIARQTLWSIGYKNDNIIMNCYRTLHSDYKAHDQASHSDELNPNVSCKLLTLNQILSPAKQQAILSSNIVPGQTWMSGTDVAIVVPNDLSTSTAKLLPSYVSANNSFAGTSWIATVVLNRTLNGMNGCFKNCTNLGTISLREPKNAYPVFEGIIPQGIFEGCSSLRGFDNLGHDLPIKYKSNCLKNSAFNNSNDELMVATEFESGCLANTYVTDFVSIGISTLNNTAFNSNGLRSCMTFGYSGTYFTGRDGFSICDINNKIVVGSGTSVLSDYSGVEANAFKGLQVDYYAQVSNKNGYTIGENAFAGSLVTEYTEKACTGTIFSKGAFENCAQLTTISIGNGATLAESTFKGCTLLANVHIPNNTSIPKNCFSGCTSIEYIALSSDIYEDAFSDCTSLSRIDLNYQSTDTPHLEPSAFKNCPLVQLRSSGYVDTPAYYITKYTVYHKGDDITLFWGSRDYDDIFGEVYNGKIKNIGDYAYCGRGLNGRIVIPDSVTRIGNYAFANNPNITAVKIPSTVKYIGDHAFDGCTGLEYFTLPDSCTYFGEGALNGCGLTNGFNCNALDYQYSDKFSYSEPLYIENTTDTTGTVTIIKSTNSSPTLTIQYSTNNKTWNVVGDTSTTALEVMVRANSKVYLRCNSSGSGNNGYYNKIACDVSHKVGGNIMSLLYGSSFNGQTEFPSGVNTYTFLRLFWQDTYLTDASKLILPATTLVNNCYQGMFRECSNLTKSPELPATILVDSCYNQMFYSCSNLNNIKCLAIDISASNCTNNWVNGVAASGTFVKDIYMNDWVIGNTAGIPSGWTTVGLNSSTGTVSVFNSTLDLTNALCFKSISTRAFKNTNIAIVRLPRNCSSIMDEAFYGCNNLTELQINSNVQIADYAFYGCTNLKDIWISPNVTSAPTIGNQTLSNIGSGVNVGTKILHVPSTLQNDTDFTTSHFYTTLVNTLSYSVDWYTV